VSIKLVDTTSTQSAPAESTTTVPTLGGKGAVFGYEEILGELGNMNKDFMSQIDSKVTTKLEEMSKRLEEVASELKKHEEEVKPKKEEGTDVMKTTTGAPYERKPTKLEDAMPTDMGQARVVYRPVFIKQAPTSRAGLTMSEEELRRRREERAKKLEEIKHKMEERRKKLAYEAATTTLAVQGKAEVQSTTDTPSADTKALVPNPLSASLPSVPQWMADILKAQAATDKRIVG